MAMNMAKTRKAAKKKNTPTTLANESTPRLKKTKKKIGKMRLGNTSKQKRKKNFINCGGKFGKTKTLQKNR